MEVKWKQQSDSEYNKAHRLIRVRREKAAFDAKNKALDAKANCKKCGSRSCKCK